MIGGPAEQKKNKKVLIGEISSVPSKTFIKIIGKRKQTLAIEKGKKRGVLVHFGNLQIEDATR